MNQKKQCSYCMYNHPVGFPKCRICGITGCRISPKSECHCGKLEEINQQEIDNAVRALPDAGNFLQDIYIIPLIETGYILVFKKCTFAISNIGVFVKWELEKVERLY